MKRAFAAFCLLIVSLLTVYGFLDIVVIFAKYLAIGLRKLGPYILPYLPLSPESLTLRFVNGTLADDFMATNVVGWITQAALLAGAIFVIVLFYKNIDLLWAKFWAGTTIGLIFLFIALVVFSAFWQFGFGWIEIAGFFFQRGSDIIKLAVQGALIWFAIFKLDLNEDSTL